MFLQNYFDIFGILGLILIIWGIFLPRNKKRSIIYIFGGLCLLIYSIDKKDLIFIILQSCFLLASFYEFWKNHKK